MMSFQKNMIKKQLIFRPRKVKDKIEITDDIPRRWKESPETSPPKTKEFFRMKTVKEYQDLQTSSPMGKVI